METVTNRLDERRTECKVKLIVVNAGANVLHRFPVVDFHASLHELHRQKVDGLSPLTVDRLLLGVFKLELRLERTLLHDGLEKHLVVVVKRLELTVQ